MASPRSSQKTLFRKLLWGLFVGGWLATTTWGIVVLADYSFRAGDSGLPGDAWPPDTQLRRDDVGKFFLVVALHPECPCSRATVEEIDTLLAARPNALRVVALFVDEGTDVLQSDLWARASRIPGVKVVHDATAADAHRFSFRTSGETRLYAPNGSLCFRGGITLARGHVGANPGRTAVIAAIDSRGTAALTFTPVFGCALFGPRPASES